MFLLRNLKCYPTIPRQLSVALRTHKLSTKPAPVIPSYNPAHQPPSSEPELDLNPTPESIESELLQFNAQAQLDVTEESNGKEVNESAVERRDLLGYRDPEQISSEGNQKLTDKASFKSPAIEESI